MVAKMGRPRKEEAAKRKSLEPPPSIPLRSGGRVKKAKVVFDPSESYLPKKRTKDTRCESVFDQSFESKDSAKVIKLRRKSINLRGFSPEADDYCSVCSLAEAKRNRKLVFCLDCNYKVHPKCLDVNFKDLHILRDNYRCDECKTCSTCYEGHEEGPMVTCSVCVNSYHHSCHVPKVDKSRLDEKIWSCTKCRKPTAIKNETSAAVPAKIIKAETQQPSSTVIATPSTSTFKEETASSRRSSSANGNISESSTNSSRNSTSDNSSIIYNKKNSSSKKPSVLPAKKQKANDIDEIARKPLPKILPNIFEISTWSTEKVTNYFGQFFPTESEFFAKNDIDGTALLLLKRSDIVRKLPYPVGRILNLYNLIVKLQNGSNDTTLCWM